MRTTEKGIRNLPRLSDGKKHKLVPSVRKDYAKLIKRVEHNLGVELSG